jgi:hypothetical protein
MPSSLLLVVLGLLEKKIRRQFLILVARKVCLNDLISSKSKSDESLDSIAFLWRNADSLPTRWKCTIVTFLVLYS